MHFIIFIFVGLVFIFIIVTMFSPKLRLKMMIKDVKATKYMLDEEENLTDIVTKTANIIKEMIKVTIKASLTNDEMYCKHCGK